MGWCSATRIFDTVADELLDSPDETVDSKKILESLVDVLEDMDWDCQTESKFIEHPTVKQILNKRHPRWEL